MIKKREIKVDENLQEDDFYVAYMRAALEQSKDDLKNGRFMTVEESIERMKKSMKVLISDKAHEDIADIFEYISRNSVKYANGTFCGSWKKKF